MEKDLRKIAIERFLKGEAHIDRADQRTKAVYRTLRSIWDVTIANSTDQQPLPVLTVPLSR